MAHGPNENHHSISSDGIKEAQGFVRYNDHRPGSSPNEMPLGITSMTPHHPDPHGKGPRANVHMPPDR